MKATISPNNPMFSVIVPTYNRAYIIGVVIDAILAQSYADFELLVVDDGSTDNTLEVLAQYNDSRLQVIEQPNQRQTQARRCACESAQGQFLAFCDSDDVWHQDYLGTIHNAIKQYDTDYIFTNYQVEGEERPRIDDKIDATKQWLGQHSEQVKPNHFLFSDLYIALLDYQPIFTSCQVVKTSHYRAIGGISPTLNCPNGKRVTSEDSHIIRRCALGSKAMFINQNLVLLGRQEDNLSASFVSNLRGGLFILLDILGHAELTDEQRSRTLGEIKRHRQNIARQLYYFASPTDVVEFYQAQPSSDFNWKNHLHYMASYLKMIFKKQTSERTNENE